MDTVEKLNLITRNTEEVLTIDDLRVMLETGVKLKHYIGFEISGKLHIGSGLMTAFKIADFLKANVHCSIFLADWHSWINNKLGGDLETIHKIGAEFFKHMLIASLKVAHVDESKVNFVLGSKLYEKNDEYWLTVVDICKHLTLHRVMRAITIAGRKEGEAVNFATLLYPPMQVADIFVQGINLAHAGIDQRKAHVIAREVALKLKYAKLMHNNKPYKPIAVHHPLVPGLTQPPKWPITSNELKQVLSEMKMSKSKPQSAIFITDTPEQIKTKLRKAFCPEKETCYNPVLIWAKQFVFNQQAILEVHRPEKYGGDVCYHSYDHLEQDFRQGKLHPLDLKNALADYLIKLLEPARKYLAKPSIVKLQQQFEQLKVTR